MGIFMYIIPNLVSKCNRNDRWIHLLYWNNNFTIHVYSIASCYKTHGHTKMCIETKSFLKCYLFPSTHPDVMSSKWLSWGAELRNMKVRKLLLSSAQNQTLYVDAVRPHHFCALVLPLEDVSSCCPLSWLRCPLGW